MIIIKDKTVYTVRFQERQTSDNYNIFASVFKKGEKSPMFGTSFKSDSCATKVLDWAKDGIENYNKLQTL
jgi:hypothetical protein